MEDFGVHNYNQQISNDSTPLSMEEPSHINPMNTYVSNATAPSTSRSNSNAPTPPTTAGSNRARGRPRGSKTKPKEKDPFFITIPPGHDVIKEVRNFASEYQMVVTIIGGAGMISNFSLRNPFPHGTHIRTDGGFFNLISITGTVSATTGSLASSGCSVAISVAGLHGNVFGGVIEDTFTAETEVALTVVTSRKPTNYRLPG